MSDKVLVRSRFSRALLARIGEQFDLLDAKGRDPSEAFARDDLAHVRALVTMGNAPFGGAEMDRLPSLKAIVCYGTGYDGIDLAAAAARGIAVGNSPAANAAAVADLAVTLMLAVTRRLLPADDYVRSGGWAGAKPSPWLVAGPGNPGRKVGVYGIGEIGRKIAVRMAAFECDVAYHSRSRHDLPYRYIDSLAALADWCDVLIVAVRAGADTHHVIDAAMLERLGPQGYLINISRGSVIDEAALTAALRNETIAGAGLDVYATEPHAPDALTAFPNVVVTPHIGGHTADSHVAMQDCVIANLRAALDGRPLPYAVA